MLRLNSNNTLTIDLDSRKESGLKLCRAARVLAVYKGLDPETVSAELLEIGCEQGYYRLISEFESRFGDICELTEMGRPINYGGKRVLPIVDSPDELPQVRKP